MNPDLVIDKVIVCAHFNQQCRSILTPHPVTLGSQVDAVHAVPRGDRPGQAGEPVELPDADRGPDAHGRGQRVAFGRSHRGVRGAGDDVPAQQARPVVRGRQRAPADAVGGAHQGRGARRPGACRRPRRPDGLHVVQRRPIAVSGHVWPSDGLR